MKKQLFLDIQKRLADIKDNENKAVIKHFDLWNRQIEFIQAETPFEFPAVFIEFMPHNWITKGRSLQQSVIKIRLHIVTRWFAQTAKYSPSQAQALEYLDLSEVVLKHLTRMAATQSNGFVRVASIPNHNHGGILDSIEEYETAIWSDSAVVVGEKVEDVELVVSKTTED